HHDGSTGANQRGYLKAQGFAATSRHQYQGIATIDNVTDYHTLLVAKGLVAKDRLQYLLCGAVRGFGAQNFIIQRQSITTSGRRGFCSQHRDRLLQ
ncbi:MAG: hypothetical protein ACI89D_000912, partial [Bermanella sp.]